ncbi:MAG: HD family phosphohydrolase [Anaerolineae bacterium]
MPTIGRRRLISTSERKDRKWWQVASTVAMGVLLVAVLSLILLWQFVPNQLQLEAGDVSPQEVRAPRRITYVSQIQTETAREEAVAAVEDVYDPPDVEIARQQVIRASQVYDYLDSIRHDPYLSFDEKRALIEDIPELAPPVTVIDNLLNLDDERWEAVVKESLSGLEQSMRGEIRPGQVTAARRLLPSYVSRDLSREEAQIVNELAKGFIRANSFYNAPVTEGNRAKARAEVKPVSRTILEGEAILREGDIVTPEDLEALQALELLGTQTNWQNIVGTFLFVAVTNIVLVLYLYRLRPTFWQSHRQMILVWVLIVLFVVAAKLTQGRVVLPYLLPLPAVSMLLIVLLNPEIAIITTLFLSLMLGFITGNPLNFELMVYGLAGGVVGCLSLWRVERLNIFVRAGTYVALTNLAVVMLFRLQTQRYDTQGLLTLAAAAIVNGALSASLALGGFSAMGNILNIATAVQLLDLARPNQPLLRQLLLKAPGTYHHTIIIGNLAERTAEAIGADPLLARVGAYYHDIGKTLRPYFFSENQSDGINVHERLDPKTSAQIIISHVKDGLELAKKYGLPEKIRAFIPEHHGTRLATYFYHQAVEQAGDEAVDEEDFRYPGPKPQTPESAIVMLADGVEAAARATHPTSPEEIDKLLRKIINDRLLSGQLDECDLSLRDIDLIREAFANILQGIFHPRVQYPEERKEPEPGPEISGEGDRRPER